MSVKVIGENKLFNKINKLAKWSERDSNKLVEIGHRVGNVYANYIKANVKDNKFERSMFRGKNKPKGQLRRSGGTWQPKKNSNVVLGGPRTKSIRPKRKTTKKADGFYASIVEKGDFGKRFGGKHTTQNTGVFTRGIKATNSRSENLQLMLYRREFKNYVKRL